MGTGTSCEGIPQQKIERLVEIYMGNAAALRPGDARRLEDRKFGEPFAPKPGGRRRHRHYSGEKTNAPLTAFGQSDDDVDLAAVDHVGAVLGAADRGERGRRDASTGGLGA